MRVAGFAVRVRSLVVLVLALAALPVSAQSVSTAQINGTVRDGGGLALPGVSVAMIQTDTGLTRTAVTDDGGLYTLTNLPVGPYRFEAMLQGFRSYVQTGIVLQVNANPTLNVTLELGQLAETITVQGTAPLVETRNPGIGQIVSNQQVNELPLNGRQLTQLVLTAGLASGGTGAAAAPAANILNSGVRNYPTVTVVVAGGVSNGMAYIVDGGTHTDPFNGLNLPLPFPDALQEFKVETSALPAQYGYHSSAAITAVTKSGTNTVHGDGFEFLRDHRFNAVNPFTTPGPDGKRPDDGLHRDQFGGTIGGPLIANKLFYFGGYQGTVVNVTPNNFFQFVPTAQMLAGDFSTITSPACNAGRTIALRAPFAPNNTISPAQFSPAALNILARLPKTSDPCGRVDFSRNSRNREHLGLGRVDYQATGNHSMFGRYQVANYHSDPDADPTVNAIAYSLAPINSTVHSAVFGDTYLLGPNTVSSFRATFNHVFIQKGPYLHFFDMQDVGVRNYANMQPGFMRMTVSGGFSLGATNASGSVDPTSTVQATEDLSLVRGAHQITVGGNYIHTSLYASAVTNAPGNFTFTGTVTGLGLADFMLGRTNQAQQGMPYFLRYRQHYVGAYVQDSWKVVPRLTLNAGLRWEPSMPMYETRDSGTFSHFDLNQWATGVRSKVYVNAPMGIIFEGDSGYPGTSLSANHWMTLAPRVSGAWDVNGDARTTVRAAWGRFFDTPHLFSPMAFGTAPPLGSVVTVAGALLDDPYASAPGGNPFPLVRNANMAFPVSGQYPTWPLDLKPWYSDQWNISVQRQIGTSWAVSANYIDQRGRRLPIGDNINPAVYLPGATTANTNQRRVLFLQNPTEGQYYGNIIQVEPIGTSVYNALLLTAQHRTSQGLTLTSNWTLAKCITDQVNYEPAMAGLALVRPGDVAYDRGSCGASDRRHIVNLSAVYQLPGRSSGALRRITNDWQVSAIARAQSGNHFNVTTGVDSALTNQANQRPNQALGNAYVKQGFQWLNPAAFSLPGPGTYGDVANNALIGLGLFNVDMGLVRSFRLHAQQAVQVRLEAFNVFNRIQLGLPVATMNSSNFGAITSTAADQRILQFALKYVF